MDTSKVIKNSFIFILTSILQGIIGFFLLPLYTAYLTPEQYGIVGVTNSISAFLSVIYMLSLNAAASRFYYEYKDAPNKIKLLWGNIIIVIFFVSFFLTVVITIFHHFLIDPFIDKITFFPYIFIALISITLNPLYLIYQTSLQVRQNALRFGLNYILFFILNVAITLFFVIVLHKGALGVLLSNMITNIIFFIYTLTVFLKDIKFTINVPMLKVSLKYSLPIIPHNLSGWMINLLNRIFINNISGTANVGLYNVGYLISSPLQMTTQGVNQAYVPWFYEQMKNGPIGQNLIKTFIELGIIIYGFIGLSLSLFSQEILTLMTSKHYILAWEIIPFLSFGYVFDGIYFFMVAYIFYNTSKTKYLPLITFFSAVFNVVLNILLIPRYGILGSASVAFIGSFVTQFIVTFFACRIEKIQVNFVKIYTYLFFYITISILIICFCSKFGFVFKLVIYALITLVLIYLHRNNILLIYNKFIKGFIKKVRIK